MAKTAVELLLGKIIGALENEAALIGGIRGELEDLQRELPWMQSFLEDAERKRVVMTEGERQWVKDVRATAFIAEDLIDDFMYHMNRQQIGGRLRKFFNKAIRTPKILWVKHCIGKQLQEVKKMVRDIPERRQRYSIEHMQQETRSTKEHHQRWARNRAEASLFFKDTDLVGIEEDGKLLVGWLTADAADDDAQRAVISVVGMGGSGKTTLVAKAYNNQIVKRRFDCYAWITVSQTYEVEDLLRSMVKDFYLARKEALPQDLSSKTYRELLELLVSYLRPKRYVVVLDDVWDPNLWNDIRVSLPDEGRGSRVLLTTRREDIAFSSFGVRSHIHRLKPLDTADAWKLFCSKAFSSSNIPYSTISCPPDLEAIGWELVTRCDGLPLAIVALGGIMSSKKVQSEWRIVYDRFNWELSNNPELDRVKQILWLSFEDLTPRLKCCFLYCCLFPEDYLIKRKRLIRLWMAEGFVENVSEITAEEVAEGYLMELIRRSMLQVVKKNEPGGPKACKMHDLMRDLAIWRSKAENFCTLYHGGNTNEQDGARRLSIQTLKLNSWKRMSTLRSLFVFHKRTYETSAALEMLARFRLLRVLDLQDSPIEGLSDDVGKLFNLRYLNLRRTKVKELPKSIGNLGNLQTLITADSEIQMLPSEITKLHNLRHLITYRYSEGSVGNLEYCYGTPVPSNICDELQHLQVLAYVEADASFIKQVRKMTQLTRIGFTRVREADQENLCSSIADMRLLSYLLVMVRDEEDYLRIDGLSSAPPRLQTLLLAGKLEKVPRWFHSLGSLTSLGLHWSRLREEEDPLPYIQALPNLGQLALGNAYVGTKLCFAKGFHKLTQLYLYNFPQLNGIVIGIGVMPGLQTMELARCPELKMLPCGIEYLTHLQQLNLRFVSNELIKRIRGEGSVDRPKVRHISEIHHYYHGPSGLLVYQNLS